MNDNRPSKPDSLFRDATRDVKPLKTPSRSTGLRQSRPKPKPGAKFTRADQQAVLRESLETPDDPTLVESGEEIAFKRPGVPETLLKRLRRGHFKVDAELDLHGLTSPQARAELRDFIVNELSRGSHCVRIIHGKGRGSGPRGPVLKNVVNICLRRMDVVVAFGSARPLDGGSGAVYVLLNNG